MGAVRHVQVDVPKLLVLLVDNENFFWRLDEDRNVEGRFEHPNGN